MNDRSLFDNRRQRGSVFGNGKVRGLLGRRGGLLGRQEWAQLVAGCQGITAIAVGESTSVVDSHDEMWMLAFRIALILIMLSLLNCDSNGAHSYAAPFFCFAL
mmetsp:Transcript_12526/g.25120  ORF Transcript_12526/g.25120 Transcript_12526/m.25120 type:complete len:103 (-) Transcript_12526:33-341(-)